MTETYYWNPMPQTLDVRCPQWGRIAYFEFAEIVRIKEKKDVPFFKDSDQFDHALFEDRWGQRWHGAIYFPGLHGRTIDSIRELPDDYSPTDWAHSKYPRHRMNLDLGSVDCDNCGLRSKHQLKWP